MKAGVGIDLSLGLSRAQQRALVVESARLGYQSLWTPSGLTGRSIFQTCREWWEASTDIVAGGLTVGTSVIPFPGWTVPTLAAESASLSDVTAGKFNLGIGLGSYPSEDFRAQFGLPLVPTVTYTREYLVTLRGLLAGQRVDYSGQAIHLHDVQLGIKAPRVPVYVAAMGPQMLRLAGEASDGVTPNWSSAEQVAVMRQHVAEGARRAGRDPADIPFAQYIRVCVDEDEDTARQALATQVLGYGLAQSGQPKNQGYRAHFGRMGFDELFTELEARRDAGTPMSELVDAVPPELLLRVGYFGRPSGAAEALQRLSLGLDEAMVRLISVRSGDLEACLSTVRACKPQGWAATAS